MKTKTINNLGTLLRRGMAVIAALVALTALGGTAQAAAPIPTSDVTARPFCSGWLIQAERARARGEIERAIDFEAYFRQCEFERDEEEEEHPLTQD